MHYFKKLKKKKRRRSKSGAFGSGKPSPTLGPIKQQLAC